MYKALSGIFREENRMPTIMRIFERMEVSAIQSKHIGLYLDAREAKIAANREIALLSHVFRKTIRWGIAGKNPCLEVERNKEKPSDRYIED